MFDSQIKAHTSHCRAYTQELGDRSRSLERRDLDRDLSFLAIHEEWQRDMADVSHLRRQKSKELSIRVPNFQNQQNQIVLKDTLRTTFFSAAWLVTLAELVQSSLRAKI